MRTILIRARRNIVAIAAIALLCLAGVATANRAIRDNTINTRDIKNNQVNTRDLRDGAIRGVDVRDGSLGVNDLSPAVVSYAGTTTLFDPRAHDQDSDGNGAIDDPAGTVAGHVCCLSWKQGPVDVEPVAVAPADPIPGSADGRPWRSVTLDPGSYVLQSTGYALEGSAKTAGVASRLFLGGRQIADLGYAFYPATATALPPVSYTHTTTIEVGTGSAGDRLLTQRVASIEGKAAFSDNLLIWEVTPR